MDFEDNADLYIPIKPLIPIASCSICINTMNKCVMTQCSHNFCQACIFKWLSTKKTCPTCCKLITKESLLRNLIFDQLIQVIINERNAINLNDENNDIKRKSSTITLHNIPEISFTTTPPKSPIIDNKVTTTTTTTTTTSSYSSPPPINNSKPILNESSTLSQSGILIKLPSNTNTPTTSLNLNKCFSLNTLATSLEPKIVYDQGATYSPSITEEHLLQKFKIGISNIAAISVEIGYPTVASIPHSVVNAFKNLLALTFETDVTFEAAEKFKAAASTTVATTATATKAPVVDQKVKKEESSEEDLGGGLFGDD